MRAAIPTIITQISKANKKIKLGSLYPRRDFTYVMDTVNGFVLAMRNKKCIGETINLGTGYDFSIGETLKNIEKLINKKIKVQTDKSRIRPKKSEVTRLLSSNAKAKKILKWKPDFIGKKGFRMGLKHTIDWFQNPENLKHYKYNIYNF